jgi:hypothetical protein
MAEDIVEGQKPSPSDIEALKKELAEMKNEMMRKELEEIKREKMKEELEEMKAESARQQAPRYVEVYVPQLSILNVIMAGASLLVAGYLLGILYGFNIAAEVDKYLVSYGYPAVGALLLTVASVVLIFIGLGLVTMAKK